MSRYINIRMIAFIMILAIVCFFVRVIAISAEPQAGALAESCATLDEQTSEDDGPCYEYEDCDLDAPQ